MMVRFTVPGEPIGKGRPKFRRVGQYTQTYTPKKTVEYENLVRLQYQLSCKGTYFDDDANLFIHVNCYMSIPQSTSKKKRQEMMNGKIRPLKKIDWDNAGKIIADALNGVAYKDDSHIVDGRVVKFYSERPRCEVIIADHEITQPLIGSMKAEEVKQNEKDAD